MPEELEMLVEVSLSATASTFSVGSLSADNSAMASA